MFKVRFTKWQKKNRTLLYEICFLRGRCRDTSIFKITVDSVMEKIFYISRDIWILTIFYDKNILAALL